MKRCIISDCVVRMVVRALDYRAEGVKVVHLHLSQHYNYVYGAAS